MAESMIDHVPEAMKMILRALTARPPKLHAFASIKGSEPKEEWKVPAAFWEKHGSVALSPFIDELPPDAAQSLWSMLGQGPPVPRLEVAFKPEEVKRTFSGPPLMAPKWGLTRMLAWIAFRRDDMLTDNPRVLRGRMRRHKSKLVEKNPAADLLKVMRAGEVSASDASYRLPNGERKAMSPIDWMQISEDDVWRMAEFDWMRNQGKAK
jgi:hypothetical protein